MTKWYWMKNGQKQGPVNTSQLKQLARAGQLQPTDTIWRDGLPNWVSASKAKGLFAKSSVSPRKDSVATADEDSPTEIPFRAEQILDPSLPRNARVDTTSTKNMRCGQSVHRKLAKWSLLARIMLPAGFGIAVIGVSCPWYSVSVSSSSTFGSAAMTISISGWWTIPGILTGVVAIPGMILGLFHKRTPVLLAGLLGLGVMLMGVLWGIFYAPSATSSVGLIGFDWGVFVTLAGGAIAAIMAFLTYRTSTTPNE